MRRNDEEIRSFDDMLEVVAAGEVCRLGLRDGDEVYIVPLNYGYETQDGRLVLYFHGAKEGRKIDLIRANGRAGFEIDRRHHLETSDIACGFGYRFESVIGHGRIRLVEEREEKIHALTCMMKHYSPEKSYPMPDPMIELVGVLRLDVETWSCKKR